MVARYPVIYMRNSKRITLGVVPPLSHDLSTFLGCSCSFKCLIEPSRSQSTSIKMGKDSDSADMADDLNRRSSPFSGRQL